MRRSHASSFSSNMLVHSPRSQNRNIVVLSEYIKNVDTSSSLHRGKASERAAAEQQGSFSVSKLSTQKVRWMVNEGIICRPRTVEWERIETERSRGKLLDWHWKESATQQPIIQFGIFCICATEWIDRQRTDHSCRHLNGREWHFSGWNCTTERILLVRWEPWRASSSNVEKQNVGGRSRKYQQQACNSKWY